MKLNYKTLITPAVGFFVLTLACRLQADTLQDEVAELNKQYTEHVSLRPNEATATDDQIHKWNQEEMRFRAWFTRLKERLCADCLVKYNNAEAGCTNLRTSTEKLQCGNDARAEWLHCRDQFCNK